MRFELAEVEEPGVEALLLFPSSFLVVLLLLLPLVLV